MVHLQLKDLFAACTTDFSPGRHTGTTELPLTKNGEMRIRATGKALVGDDRLIVPSMLAHMYPTCHIPPIGRPTH